MVKIEAKKKSEGSRILLLLSLFFAGCVSYILFLPADDSSIGSLLALEVSSPPVDSEKSVIESNSALLSNVESEKNTEIPDQKNIAVSYLASNSLISNLVGCDDLLRKGYRQPGKVYPEVPELNPNNDQIHARYVKELSSKFWISVHHESFDKVQHDSIMSLGVYNRQALTQAALDIFQTADPGARIIDVGAHIGWFSLLARGLGLEVEAFEPLPANVFRLCESLFLNRWSNISEKKYPGPYVNIHPVALSDKNHVQFTMSRTGANLFTNGGADQGLKVSSMTLDKFVEDRSWSTKDTIVLLKVHTIGMEDKIIAGATNLLDSKRVKNVLLGIDPTKYGTKAIGILLSKSYKLHKWGDSNGPDQEASGFPRDANALVNTLSEKLKGSTSTQCFLWFKLQ
jgi:FkbM family methyltransferase